MVQCPALAITEHASKIENFGLTGGEQFLAGEFRRGPQIERIPLATRPDQVRGEGMQVGLVAGRDLKGCRFDLDETGTGKPGPQGRGHAAPGLQIGPAGGMRSGQPERGGFAQINLENRPLPQEN